MESSKVFLGVAWSIIQRFGTMLIAFIANIVLARLLTPDDFGAVGMLLLFIAIANTFIDSGFGTALIQKTYPTDNDYTTVFYINLFLSIIFYLGLFTISPYVATFYNLPLLKDLLRIEGLVVILNAFCIIQTTILRKKMDFKQLSIANLLGNLIGTIISIIFAYKGFGVWSLVIRQLLVSFFISILLWRLSKWKPLGKFSWESFKELFNFGGFMLLSNIVSTILNNVQTIIIGKMFSQNELGNYTQARQLRDIPANSISTVINQVLYPDFSNTKNQRDIKHKLVFSVQAISYIISAIMLWCVLVSEQLIIILYTDIWIDSVNYFKVLCIGGIFTSLQGINYNLIASKGYSKLLFMCDFILVVISIILMIICGFFWKIKGLLYTMVFSTFLFYLVYALISSRLLNMSVWNQIKKIIQGLLVSVVCYCFTYLINSYFISSMSNWLILILSTIIFFSFYLIISYIIKSEILFYLLSKINIKNK